MKKTKKTKKTKRTLKEHWFSWGWLVFWIIVFWPVAIIYLLIKSKEKNGKDVYDGEIVNVIYGKHYNEPMGLQRIGHVKYCNKTASFVIKINNSKVEIHFYDSRTKDIEVIGNIYSNPELLTKK